MSFQNRVTAFTCLVVFSFFAKCAQAQIDENHIYVETALLTGRAVASNDAEPTAIFPDLTGLFLKTNSKAIEIGYKMKIFKLGIVGIWGSNNSSESIYEEKLKKYWSLSSIFAIESSAKLGKFAFGLSGKIGPGILQYSKKQLNKPTIVNTNIYPSMFLGATGIIGIRIKNIALTLNPAVNMVFCKSLLVYSYGGGLGFNFYL